VTRLAIGLDVGGTKVAGLVLAEDGAVLAGEERPAMADDADAALGAVIQLGQDLQKEHEDVVAAGIGAAGLVDHDAGVFRFAPNLSWRELPLRDRVAEALDLPVVLDNDANAAGWGEFRFGAGAGHREVLMVTVGTGIGGAIVTGGRLLRGAHGFAAEIGHIVMQPGGPRCGCGNAGCWEQLASGTAIGRLGREAARDHPASIIAELAGSPERVSGVHVTEAGRRGDHIAAHILAEVGAWLGVGLAGLANVLDPEVVVVGGGVGEIGEPVLGPARRTFREHLEGAEHRPEIPLLEARLGNEAGAIGAAALALDEAGGRLGVARPVERSTRPHPASEPPQAPR